MKERSIALALMVISAILFASALSIPEPRYEPLGAGFLGKAVPAVIFLLGLILAIQSRQVPVQSSGKMRFSPSEIWASIGLTVQLFLALGLYLFGLGLGEGFWGYLIASVLFFMLCAYILAPGVFGNAAQLAVTFVCACVLCSFIGWGFSAVLHVSLP